MEAAAKTALPPKGRIEEIDIAKGLGILCVLLGHRSEGAVMAFLYLFHMPLFFVLSGLLIRDEELSLRKAPGKDAKLLAAYVFYSAVFLLFRCIRSLKALTLLEGLASTVSFFGIDILWFLGSLFLAKLAVRLLKKRDAAVQAVVVFGVYAVCFFASRLLLSLRYESMPMKLLRLFSWSAVRTGVVLVFVWLGCFFRKSVFAFLEKCRGSVPLCAGAAAVSFLCLLPFVKGKMIDYHLLENGPFLLDIFTGCCGTVMILALSVLAGKGAAFLRRYLAFAGKSTLHFMASEFFKLSVPLYLALERALGAPLYKPVGFIVYTALLSAAVRLLAPLLDRGIGQIEKGLRRLL